LQYKTEGDLDRHLRAIHLDERPFVCSYCKHGFNKKSNLVKHTRMVHERVRPYQCDQVPVLPNTTVARNISQQNVVKKILRFCKKIIST
jgi:uncharacterized Zn-finger protein